MSDYYLRDSAEALPLSVNLMPEGPVGEVVRLAVQAERLGYRRCWVYDEGLVTRDIYVTLTAIALATERILLGPGVTNPYVRHPGVTAAAVATLDELSGGRAFVGLGAGGGLTLGPLAIDHHRPVVALRDMVSSLRDLFEGRTVDFDGEVFSFRSASLGYGQRDVEVFLAGRGPLVTQLGGEVADGFYLSYIHKELIGDQVAALRLKAASRPFTVVYSTMVATSEVEVAEARAALSFRLVDSPAEVREMVGMKEADCSAIREALREGGPAAAAHLVPEAWVDQFAIVGSEEEAGAELRELLSVHGIDEFALPLSRTEGAAALIERTAAMVSGC